MEEKMGFEKRITRDTNGFWEVQVRILPVEEWQFLDGWGTVFISSDYSNAKKQLDKEPGKEVAA